MDHDARDLIGLHLELERIGFTAEGDLCRLPGPEPDEIPKLYVARHGGSCDVFYRNDVPDHVRQRLRHLSPETLFADHEAVKAILAVHRPCAQMHVGRSYVVPQGTALPGPADVAMLTGADRALFEQVDRKPTHLELGVATAVVEGRAVSFCGSSRENERAAEAWVFTQPAYRGRGYAHKTVAAWAGHRIARGKVAFYSHRHDHAASRGLAMSLGLYEYTADVACF